MSAALEGCAFLKVAGQGGGLDTARKTLSAWFSRSASRKKKEGAAVA